MGIIGGQGSGRLCTLALAGALAVAAVGLGGCGSSSSSGGATTITTPSSVTVPTVQVGGAKYCQELVDAEEHLVATLPGIASAPSAVGTIDSTYQALAEQAPPSIKSSVQDVALQIKALASAVTDPAAAEKALPGIESKLGPDEEAIGTWAGTNCHAA